MSEPIYIENCILLEILEELNQFHRDADDLYVQYVAERLQRSLINYEHDMTLVLKQLQNIEMKEIRR